MDHNFKEKTVVITGGSEGVGAACARQFADAGANLVLVARSKNNLERIATELRAKTRVQTVAMDVSDIEACSSLFKKAEYEFGSVHVLINNAGFHERGATESIAIADLCKMIDINLKAPIVISRLALPYLRQSGDGAIVNIASLAGRTAVPGAATYSATKFGLRVFTIALAEELRGTNIKVAAVSPGPVDTSFIMANIDEVTDLTFSQPISTADEVAFEIMNLCVNNKVERSMPPLSGLLTTLTYLFPRVARAMRPVFENKGRRVKRRLKAQEQAERRK